MKYINLIVKPTNACNLRCKHCYAAEVGYSSNKMSLDTAESIFNFFAQSYDKIQIIWHGGEPLLMGIDFYEKILKSQNKFTNIKFSNSIQTNATLINKEWGEFLKDNNFQVGISFDGLYNDILREKTAEVIKSINILKSFNIPFGAISVVCSKTANKLIENYEFFKSIGVSYRINPMFSSGAAKSNPYLSLSTNKYVDNFIRFFSYWLYDTKCNIRVDNPLNLVLEYLGKKSTLCSYSSCLTKWLGIQYNGDIFPCGRAFTNDYYLGNLFDYANAGEIFCCDNYQKLLQGAIARRDICRKKCKLYDKCHGGCNNSALLSGDISKINFQECKIYRKLNSSITEILAKVFNGGLGDAENINPTIINKINKEGLNGLNINIS